MELRTAEVKPASTPPANPSSSIAKSPRDRDGKPDDRAINLTRSAEFEAIEACVREHGFDLPRPSNAKHADTMSRIIVDLVQDANGRYGEDKYGRTTSGFASVSFSKDWWHAARGEYAPSVDYPTVTSSIRALHQAGLISDLQVGKQGKASDVQTRFQASPDLKGIILPQTFRDSGPLVRMRDADGAPVALERTRQHARLSSFIATVNEAIASVEFGISTDCPRAKHNADGTISFGDRGHTVWTDQESLYAVHNGGWHLGGRWYGAWWQNVSSDDRKEWFVIEGGKAVVCDHEFIHPRMVYAMAGATLHGDPYIVRGFEHDRKGIKIAFNTMLNASSRSDAVGAVASFLQHRAAKAEGVVTLRDENGRRMPLESRWLRMAHLMVSAVLDAHRAVSGAFLTGIGLRLQKHDSEVMRENVKELMIERGITVLPVHDELICKAEHKEIVAESMAAALERKLTAIGNGPKLFAATPVPEPMKLGLAPLDESFIPEFDPPAAEAVSYSLEETWDLPAEVPAVEIDFKTALEREDPPEPGPGWDERDFSYDGSNNVLALFPPAPNPWVLKGDLTCHTIHRQPPSPPSMRH